MSSPCRRAHPTSIASAGSPWPPGRMDLRVIQMIWTIGNAPALSARTNLPGDAGPRVGCSHEYGLHKTRLLRFHPGRYIEDVCSRYHGCLLFSPKSAPRSFLTPDSIDFLKRSLPAIVRDAKTWNSLTRPCKYTLECCVSAPSEIRPQRYRVRQHLSKTATLGDLGVTAILCDSGLRP